MYNKIKNAFLHLLMEASLIPVVFTNKPLKRITLSITKYSESYRKILAVCGFFFTLYGSSFAQFSGGTGIQSDPYQVATAANLDSVRNYLNAYFIQTADINLSGYANWDPIGTFSTPFTGNYNGNGKTISNLTINRSSSNEQGLFGFLSGGAILKKINIEGANITGGVNIGILAGIIATGSGLSDGSGTIDSCSASGTVNATARVGGIIGSVQNAGAVISSSFSSAQVTANGSSFNGSAGGIAGFHYGGGTIQNCYSTGSVSGYYAGGLIGEMTESSPTVEKCYAAGTVTGSNSSGGLVGFKNSGTVTDGFFSSQGTGQSDDDGRGTPKTSAQMNQQATFTNWDFTNTWNISEDVSFPYLRWQSTYSVTYNLNGGTGATPSGGQLPKSAKFLAASSGGLTPPTGKILKEWNTASDGSGSSYTAGAEAVMPAANITLYAVWQDTPAPTTQASDIRFLEFSANKITITWINGNGEERIVIMKQGSAVDANPVDGTTYNANTIFGNGNQIGTGNYVVYAGSGNSVSISGLTKETTYHLAVFEYNNSGGFERYLTTSPANANIQTSLFSEQYSLTAFELGSAVWGDYDNDGRLDVFLTGFNGSVGISKLYRNTGAGFAEQAYSFTGVYNSSAAWGDYDNDGKLDIILAGYTGSDWVTLIYRNTGSGFEEKSFSITGAGSGSVDWGDYNNDGLLDILLTGNFIVEGSGTNRIIKTYRNTGSGFDEQSFSLPGLSNSDAAWGDYNNDGKLDFIFAGDSSSTEKAAVIYRNTGSGFAEQIYTFTGVASGSVAWGDYDNDGMLDVFLTGYTGGGNIAKLYRNTGSGFTEQGYSFTGVSGSSAAWGDYDNDGRLDIILAGYTGSDWVTLIYRNTGSGFTHAHSLTGVANCSVSWGDYDNDGKLDILLAGASDSGYIAKIYRNEGSVSNTVPAAPRNLQSSVDTTTNNVNFSWNKSTDTETPQNGLNYNIVIGSSSNGADYLSPMADRTTGLRRIAERGNSQTNQISIEAIPPGTYYWSVQSIDNTFAGSPFSTEQTFTTKAKNEPTTQASGINFSSVTQFAITINWTNGDGASRIVLVKAGSAVDGNPADGMTYTAQTTFGQGSQIGSGNYVVYNGSGTSVTVTGLSPSTAYHVAVIEYNGTNAVTNYLTANPAEGNQTTQAGSVNTYVAFAFNGSINSTVEHAPTTLGTNVAVLNNLFANNMNTGGSAGSVSGSGSGGVLTGSTQTNKYRIEGFDNSIAGGLYVYFKISPENGQSFAFSELRIHHPFGNSVGKSVVFPTKSRMKYPKVARSRESSYTGFGNLYKRNNPMAVQSTRAADEITVGLIIGSNAEVFVNPTFNSSGQYWSADLSSVSTGESVEFRIYPNNSQGESYLELNSSGIELLGDVTVLPVELTSFASNVVEGGVLLNWSTATEVNNYGFQVQRKTEENDWIEIGFVQGHGNTNSPKDYSFTDKNVLGREYFYRLKQIDIDGSFEYSYIVRADLSGITGVNEEIPRTYNLSQNFPNPFNPVTQIKYDLPEETFVTLKVYDIKGAEVVTIVNEEKQAGSYSVFFNAANLASGIYFYALKTKEFSSVKKLVVLK